MILFSIMRNDFIEELNGNMSVMIFSIMPDDFTEKLVGDFLIQNFIQ